MERLFPRIHLKFYRKGIPFLRASQRFFPPLTFVFSPVGMTSLMGEIVGSRTKGAYKNQQRVLLL